jgi:hypothetical protein
MLGVGYLPTMSSSSFSRQAGDGGPFGREEVVAYGTRSAFRMIRLPVIRRK